MSNAEETDLAKSTFDLAKNENRINPEEFPQHVWQCWTFCVIFMSVIICLNETKSIYLQPVDVFATTCYVEK